MEINTVTEAINNIQDADAAFNRFAVVASRIAKAKAALKARIAKLQSEAEAAMAADVSEAESLEVMLKAFCEAPENRAYFASPRKRKCENGSYGLQSSTEVELEDNFDAEAETVRLGIELCKRVIKPDLTLIRDALTAGEDVRGGEPEGEGKLQVQSEQINRANMTNKTNQTILCASAAAHYYS